MNEFGEELFVGGLWACDCCCGADSVSSVDDSVSSVEQDAGGGLDGEGQGGGGRGGLKAACPEGGGWEVLEERGGVQEGCGEGGGGCGEVNEETVGVHEHGRCLLCVQLHLNLHLNRYTFSFSNSCCVRA